LPKNSLDKLFLKISAEKGNKYAKDVALQNLLDKVKEVLNEILEFISINLQAEYNRISSSPLGQISTEQIGKNIKEMTEKQFEKVMYLIEKQKVACSDIDDCIPNLLKELYSKLHETEKIKKTAEELFEMNLFHDFVTITDRIRHLDTQNIDRIFKYLSLLHLQRRISRRDILKG